MCQCEGKPSAVAVLSDNVPRYMYLPKETHETLEPERGKRPCPVPHAPIVQFTESQQENEDRPSSSFLEPFSRENTQDPKGSVFLAGGLLL